jgi:hypothetical protein
MVAFTVAVSSALQVAVAALSPMSQQPLATWQGADATVGAAAPAPTAPAPGPRVILRFQPLPQVQGLGVDTPSLRPRAVEHSDQYYTRLTIHRIGSYAILPLFAAQYVVGQKLVDGSASDGLRGAHSALAVGVVGLFGLNTITGAWNLWDSRQDPNGRTRRWVHSIAMLAADGGFAASAVLTPRRQRFRTGVGFTERGSVSTATHRAIAVGSMALATASTLMMWLWK